MFIGMDQQDSSDDLLFDPLSTTTMTDGQIWSSATSSSSLRQANAATSSTSASGATPPIQIRRSSLREDNPMMMPQGYSTSPTVSPSAPYPFDHQRAIQTTAAGAPRPHPLSLGVPAHSPRGVSSHSPGQSSTTGYVVYHGAPAGSSLPPSPFMLGASATSMMYQSSSATSRNRQGGLPGSPQTSLLASAMRSPSPYTYHNTFEAQQPQQHPQHPQQLGLPPSPLFSTHQRHHTAEGLPASTSSSWMSSSIWPGPSQSAPPAMTGNAVEGSQSSYTFPPPRPASASRITEFPRSQLMQNPTQHHQQQQFQYLQPRRTSDEDYALISEYLHAELQSFGMGIGGESAPNSTPTSSRPNSSGGGVPPPVGLPYPTSGTGIPPYQASSTSSTSLLPPPQLTGPILAESTSHYEFPRPPGPQSNSSQRSLGNRSQNSSGSRGHSESDSEDSCSDSEEISGGGAGSGGQQKKRKRKRRRRANEQPRDAALRKWGCAVCGKMFARPSALRTHERSHSKEKPHVCPEPSCQRPFAVPSNLRRHQRVYGHLGPEDSAADFAPESTSYQLPPSTSTFSQLSIQAGPSGSASASTSNTTSITTRRPRRASAKRTELEDYEDFFEDDEEGEDTSEEEVIRKTSTRTRAARS